MAQPYCKEGRRKEIQRMIPVISFKALRLHWNAVAWYSSVLLFFCSSLLDSTIKQNLINKPKLNWIESNQSSWLSNEIKDKVIAIYFFIVDDIIIHSFHRLEESQDRLKANKMMKPHGRNWMLSKLKEWTKQQANGGLKELDDVYITAPSIITIAVCWSSRNTGRTTSSTTMIEDKQIATTLNWTEFLFLILWKQMSGNQSVNTPFHSIPFRNVCRNFSHHFPAYLIFDSFFPPFFLLEPFSFGFTLYLHQFVKSLIKILQQPHVNRTIQGECTVRTCISKCVIKKRRRRNGENRNKDEENGGMNSWF